MRETQENVTTRKFRILDGMVNVVIMIMAAAAFNAHCSNIASIADAYKTLVPLFGAGAGIVLHCYHLVFPLHL